MKTWLLGYNICLWTLSAHCRSLWTIWRFKHSLPLKDLMQISTAWEIMFSCSQEPHRYARVHHLLNSGSTLRFSLYKDSSIQVTQCSFTVGQRKGARKRSFLIPSTNTSSADVDHSSLFLLYRSLNMHVVPSCRHLFAVGSVYDSMIMTQSWR